METKEQDLNIEELGLFKLLMVQKNRTFNDMVKQRDEAIYKLHVVNKRFDILIKLVKQSRSLSELEKNSISSFIDSWELEDVVNIKDSVVE